MSRGRPTIDILRAWRQLESYDKEEDVYYDAYQKVMFNAFLESNIRVVQWLMTPDYKPFPFYVMHVPKKGGYRRKLWTTAQDGIIAQCWVNQHGSNIERHMPQESLGYRLESTEGDRIFQPWQTAYHVYQARLERYTFLGDDYHYIRSDLSNFYPSIDLDVLEAEVGVFIHEGDALSLLHNFIWHEVKDPNTGQIEKVDRGVAQGPPYARFLANVYLLKLDRHLKANTLAYARYVDDFVALYRGKQRAEHQLSRIDWVLEDIKLTRNIEKTKGPAPVTDGALLLDEVLRMRSEAEDLIRGVNHLDAADQREKLAEGLFAYFTRVDSHKEKDLLAAAKWLSLVLRNQQRLNAQPALIRRTVTSVQMALEAGLQNVKTLRSLFRSLLRQGEGNFPTPQLHRIVLNADEHAKLAFCEVCGVVDVGDEVFNTLTKLASEDELPFVRAAALMAFFSQRRRPHDSIIEAALNQKNTFLQARALLCLSLNDHVSIYPKLVPYVQSEDPEVVLSALYILASSKQASAQLLLRQIPIPAFRRAEVISFYVAAALCMGRLEALGRLINEVDLPEPVLADILEAQIARTEELDTLVAVMQEGDKLPESMRAQILEQVHYRLESLYPAGPNRPPNVDFVLNSSGLNQGWLQADPLMFGVRTSGVRYLSGATGSNWRPVERIACRRLPPGVTPDEWVARIRSDYGNNLCPFTAHTESGPSGDQLVVEYNIPDGFRLLADVLQTTGAFALERTVPLLQHLSAHSYSPLPLDPFHVLVNDGLQVQLFGIAGCIGPATYSGLRSSLDDTSPLGNVKFLGLLAFHLVTGTCPLIEEAELSKDYSGNKLVLRSKKLEGFPHLRTIISKCIEPDYRERYQTAFVMNDDLAATLRFLQWKNSGFVGALPLPMTALEELHATGLHIKHMFASNALAREGSALHSEKLATHLLTRLAKLGWRPRRSWAWSRIGRLRPRSQVLKMYFAAADALNTLHRQLDSDEWNFLKRVSSVLSYWALKLETGRYMRGIIEKGESSHLVAQVEALVSEMLEDRAGESPLEIDLADEPLHGRAVDLDHFERGVAASRRTDNHRYALVVDYGVRPTALLLLATGVDEQVPITVDQTTGFLRCVKHLSCRLSADEVHWAVQRLWTLQDGVDRVLSATPVDTNELAAFAERCWELTKLMERSLRRPRFVTHLARVKAAGEMGSYVRLYNLWFARPYRHYHIANIDPETERPITRDTYDFVEVDLGGWLSPTVAAVTFEPFVLQAFVGRTTDTLWDKTIRMVRTHGPGGIMLTAVFWSTIPFVKTVDSNVTRFLMAAVGGNLLSTIIDKTIDAILGNQEPSD